MFLRVVAGLAGAAVGTIVAGPAGAAIAWKVTGAAVTGNVLHLVPFGGVVADGVELISELGGTDIGDLPQDGPRKPST